MKTIKNIVWLGLLAILFFSFSNINSISDIGDTIFQDGIKQSNKVDLNSTNESDFEKAIVVDVVDGDTVKVEFSNNEIETIRLLLIDSPESVHPEKPVQPFGKEASDFMKRKLIKDTVVEIERGNPERDKYDRLLAYIWKDGENLNKKLLSEGYARVAYVYPPNTKYIDEFKQAEKEAKEKEIGVWSIDNYVREDGFYPPS